MEYAVGSGDLQVVDSVAVASQPFGVAEFHNNGISLALARLCQRTHVGHFDGVFFSQHPGSEPLSGSQFVARMQVEAVATVNDRSQPDILYSAV